MSARPTTTGRPPLSPSLERRIHRAEQRGVRRPLASGHQHNGAMTNPMRVLVTAGGGGIGAVIASTFASSGARVHICDISREALQSGHDGTPSIEGAVVDLSDDAAPSTSGAGQPLTDLGGIDVLVNNAGIAGPTADVEEVSLADWRQCLAIDLDSHFLTCRAVVPVMKEQRSGSIINMSSTAGQVGYGRRTPYAAAKWAVIGFTKSLAIELGRVQRSCECDLSWCRSR